MDTKRLVVLRGGFGLLVEGVEDVAVERSDGWFVAGIVGRDGIGGNWAFVSGIVAFGVGCELLFPPGAASRVGEFGTGLLDRGREKRGVRLLFLGRRVGVGVLHDIGVRASVASAENDAVSRRGAATDGCHRVSEEYLCHRVRV